MTERLVVSRSNPRYLLPAPSDGSGPAVYLTGLPYGSLEPARLAMGDTLDLARRVPLIEMEPRGELASSGYALASRNGEELVVLRPEAGRELTVRLPSGRHALEWFLADSRRTVAADTVTVDTAGDVALTPPGSEPCVAYLRTVGG